MQTSVLKSLTTPDIAYLGLLYEVIADIRRLDQPATCDEAFRSGVRHAIDERIPAGPGPLDWPPGRLAPGSTAADAAGMISGLLAWHSGPATRVLSHLAGTPVAIEITRAAHRALSATEAAGLAAAPGTRAYDRDGIMTAGDLAVARTRLLLIPERLPGVAWGAIQDGQPAGEALAPYGMTRGRRKVSVSRSGATVDASAVLSLGDLPIGTAGEHVTGEFCRHVASLDR